MLQMLELYTSYVLLYLLFPSSLRLFLFCCSEEMRYTLFSSFPSQLVLPLRRNRLLQSWSKYPFFCIHWECRCQRFSISCGTMSNLQYSRTINHTVPLSVLSQL